MGSKEKKWFGVTRSPEEDLALVDIIMSSRTITARRITVIMAVSVLILAVYLSLNISLFPTYPVTKSFAEKDALYHEHYPPYRLSEWVQYSMVTDIADGTLYDHDSYSRVEPVGFAFLAYPLTSRWGSRGLYMTNAFILWASAIAFFFLMLELVSYQLALASTLVLALATPNLFYATSAYPEPTAQLLLILAVFFFIKGFMSQREWQLFGLAGVTSGLLLFFTPLLALSSVLFVLMIINDRGRVSFGDRNLVSLVSGFLVVFVVFMIINRIFLGSMTMFVFSRESCLYDPMAGDVFGPGANIITGIWKLLFDSPHGLVFIMPVAMLVPMGLIVMWRNEVHVATLVTGIILAYSVLAVAAGPCPVSGEGVGSRLLVPVLPFIILPLAFLWQEQAGEKIWLLVCLVLTVYMSSFGWWTGIRRGEGVFIGALHDRDARAIILARKDLVGRPSYASSGELVERYMTSLETRDLMLWLQCLDRMIIEEITGFERIMFEEILKGYEGDRDNVSRYVESVDPNDGIRPVLPVLGGPESMNR